MGKRFLSIFPLVIFLLVVLLIGYFVFVEPIPTMTSIESSLAAKPSVTAASTSTPTPVPPTDTPTSTPTPTSTYRLTPPPTDTPTPPSPTLTHTLTPTKTSTPTDTPVPPTKTPTPPAATPTPLFPPTPTPIPGDAMVAVPNGLEMLCGPGTKPNGIDKYDLIAIVPQETPLEVLRRVVGKDDWIKVGVKRDRIDIANVNCPGRTSVFSASEDSVEGWVSRSAIKVKVELSGISPMYEFGPHLLDPKPFAERAVDETIIFTWQDYGPLVENQIYSLLLVRDDLPDDKSCYHWQTTVPEISLKPKDYDCTPGDYYWRVGLATNLNPQGTEPIWQDDSEFDERNPIGIGQPHSKKPRDSGSGRGTGEIPFVP